MPEAMPPPNPRIRAERQALAQRRRRIIFNDDGDALLDPRADTPENFLGVRLKPRLGTQLDSVFFCGGITTALFHATGTAERLAGTPAWTRERDCLQVVVEFCRRHDLEIFWTYRMNDVHDAAMPELLSETKLQHPDWLLGDRQAQHLSSSPDYWRATALNYAREEVREYVFRVIEEVGERYDVDGVEMDFARMPFLFPPGEEARHLSLLTDLVRRVRGRMDQIGEQRGRPLLLCARVPDTVALCRRIGLDIERYLEEGLLDLLVPGFGYDPFQLPTAEWVALAHGHQVPVYPCLSNSPTYGYRVSRPQEWDWLDRAVASNYWQAGADGIYDFNDYIYDDYRWRPQMPAGSKWQVIGDPQTLARQPKLYLASTGVPPHASVAEACLGPLLPLKLEPGRAQSLPVPVGDAVDSAPAGSVGAGLRVHLQATRASQGVRLSLNGQPLSGGTPTDPWNMGSIPPIPQPGEVVRPQPDVAGDCWVDFPLAAPPLRQGRNVLEIAAEPGEEGPVVRDVQVRVHCAGR